ncbi:hypothetical protein GQ44DRAFT_695830 [Phaeosphaeriaceae sp. PMI808]|nr:hypothetical protein GQ44DRAFT_695830 [Phaeosphaeriaceae sp. PMI808]
MKDPYTSDTCANNRTWQDREKEPISWSQEHMANMWCQVELLLTLITKAVCDLCRALLDFLSVPDDAFEKFV